MAEPLSESLDRLASPDHVALFHRTRAEIVAAAVPFLRIGLARGEKALLCVSAAASGEILSGLRASGVDLGTAFSRGSLISAPSWGEAGPGGPFRVEGGIAFIRAAARQARSERFAGLRLCVDLSARGGKTARGHVAEFCGQLPLLLSEIHGTAMCLHGLRDFPPEALLEALRHHPYILSGMKVLENDRYFPSRRDVPEKGAADEIAGVLASLSSRHELITDLRRRAERLKRLQATASSLLAHAEIPALLKGITEGVIALGYRMCWIGMAQPDGKVTPAASWGDRGGYLKAISVRWDDTPEGRGPVGATIRTGKPDIIRNALRSRRFAPWRAIAVAQGFRSVAAFPLVVEGKAIGALAVYAPTHDAFDREAVEELEAFALQASLVLRHVEARRALAVSEEKFRTVVEGANAIAVELDPDGRIRLFNRAAESVTGYRSAEAIGTDILDLLAPPRERERLRAEFRRILRGADMDGLTAPVLTRDGAERLVRWNARAIRDPRGFVRGIIGIGVDVTESRRAEQEHQRAQATRTRAQKMEALGSLARGIAHEFRNILGPLAGDASLLAAQGELPEPLRETVEKIRASATRAGALTSRLLGFARAGEQTIAPLSLNELAERAAAVAGRSCGRAVAVRVSLDPSVPSVEGNAEQLEQALRTLCLCARDTMPEGGTLTIATGRATLSEEDAARIHVPCAGEYAVLEVSDTGREIAGSARPELFEPFSGAWNDAEDSGLGLAAVYGIAKCHSGGISVEGRPGGGNLFRLFLSLEPHPHGTETVLVADDEPAVRDMAATLLSGLGYRTIQARDGIAACRVLEERKGPVDLVLLDLVMPRLGGREAFRKIRRIDPLVPVLVCSSVATEDLARDTLAEGAAGFLRKPYGMSELARAVRRVLDDAAMRAPEEGDEGLGDAFGGKSTA